MQSCANKSRSQIACCFFSLDSTLHIAEHDCYLFRTLGSWIERPSTGWKRIPFSPFMNYTRFDQTLFWKDGENVQGPLLKAFFPFPFEILSPSTSVYVHDQKFSFPPLPFFSSNMTFHPSFPSPSSCGTRHYVPKKVPVPNFGSSWEHVSFRLEKEIFGKVAIR